MNGVRRKPRKINQNFPARYSRQGNIPSSCMDVTMPTEIKEKYNKATSPTPTANSHPIRLSWKQMNKENRNMGVKRWGKREIVIRTFLTVICIPNNCSCAADNVGAGVGVGIGSMAAGLKMVAEVTKGGPCCCCPGMTGVDPPSGGCGSTAGGFSSCH